MNKIPENQKIIFETKDNEIWSGYRTKNVVVDITGLLKFDISDITFWEIENKREIQKKVKKKED